MSMGWVLERVSLSGGMYRGVLQGGAEPAPEIEAIHEGEVLEGLSVTPLEGEPGYAVSLPLPARLIADDVRTVAFLDKQTSSLLDSVAVIAGVAAADDVRVELDLIRAELDMLKRAFRRHIRTGD